MLGDGGGIKQALPRPILGADKVSRLLAGWVRQVREPSRSRRSTSTAARRSSSSLDGEVDSILTVEVEDGLITGVYAVRNPEKLSRIGAETDVSR